MSSLSKITMCIVASVTCLTACLDEVMQDPAAGTGCLMGVLTDGVTGARIDATAANVYVVADTGVISGSKSVSSMSGGASADFTGEYVLCGVPATSVQLPVYVNATGYQEVATLVDMPSSTTTSRIADFIVYKMEDLVTNSFTVNVQKDAANLESATVVLKPTTSRAKTLTTTTDASGNASWSAAEIAFGTSYELQVYDPEPQSDTGHSSVYGKIADIVIGSSASASGFVTYSGIFAIRVAFTTTAAPSLVFFTKDGSISPEGEFNLVFDQAVTLSPYSGTKASFEIANYGTNANGEACSFEDIGGKRSGEISMDIIGEFVKITPKIDGIIDLQTCHGIQLTYDWSDLSFISENNSGNRPYKVASKAKTAAIYLTAPLN